MSAGAFPHKQLLKGCLGQRAAVIGDVLLPGLVTEAGAGQEEGGSTT